MSISITSDQILNIKPVVIKLVHLRAYEGPCREGKNEQLTREYDEKMGAEELARLKTKLPTLYGDKINILGPVIIPRFDDFIMTSEHFKVLEEDLAKTDIFLVSGHLCQYGATQIAHRFKKPVGVPNCCLSTDVCAYLRYSGLEGYGFIDFEYAGETFHLLRAKKASRTPASSTF